MNIIVLLVATLYCRLGATEVNPTGSPVLLVPAFFSNHIEAKVTCNDHSEWCSREQTNLEPQVCNSEHQQNFATCKACEDMGNDWHAIWLSSDQFNPEMMDCWTYKMGMMYQDKVYKNNEGVQVRVPGFGDPSSVEFFGHTNFSFIYTNLLVEAFIKHGYSRGHSIRAAPYDWRLSADMLHKSGYFQDVKQLVETMYRENDDTAVTIVAHSSGAPIMLYFLTNTVSQQWKERHVKAFVTLGGTWKGAAIFLGNVVSGNSLDFPSMDPLDPLKMRSVMRSLPAHYDLLPIQDEYIWDKEHVVVETPTKNYTVYDYEDLFTDMSFPQGYEQYKSNLAFLTALPPPNVPVYCFYGSGLDTPIGLVYDDNFPDTQPTFVMGKGDSFYTDASLQACAIWKGLQKQSVETRSFPGVMHHGIVMFTNPEVIQAVLDAVIN